MSGITKENETFVLVYNLQTVPYFSYPIPGAYVVNFHKQKLGYSERKATPENFERYIGKQNPDVHSQLITICELLKPTALFQRFGKSVRKIKTIEELLQNQPLAKQVTVYIGKKLEHFYALIIKHQLVCTLQAERDVPWEAYRISFSDSKLRPILTFVKTNEQVVYTLQLEKESECISPADFTIQILLEEPGILCLGQTLYYLAEIDAKKIKPFLDKHEVFIPKKHIRTYFETYIRKIARKVQIHAEGFEVETNSELAYTELHVSQDIFSDDLIAAPVFIYNDKRFDHTSSQTTATSLHMNKDSIVVERTERNKNKEVEILEIIKKQGLEENRDGYFTYSAEPKQPFALYHWLVQHQDSFEDKGIRLPTFYLQTKEIRFLYPTLKSNVEQHQDWFDIQGTVEAGDFKVSFLSFIENIREDDCFYRLPDGTYMIIPPEWMQKYQSLARISKTKNAAIRIPKSNYTVLENLELDQAKRFTFDKKEVTYHPSPNFKAQLRPYQKQGVEWLLRLFYQEMGACLADDMGLGKTVQIIALLDHIQHNICDQIVSPNIQFALFDQPLETKEALKTLIVVPASLTFNWKSEIKTFAPHLTIFEYTGSKRKQWHTELSSYDVILTTYHTVSRDLNLLQKHQFQYLIADESQQIKNRNSIIFKALQDVNAKHRISLSGTPIENSLADLWSQLQFINPEILGTFSSFRTNFIKPILSGNTKRLEELQKIIHPFVLRRTKDEVLDELPELSEHVRFCEMDTEQRKHYDREKTTVRTLLIKALSEPSSESLTVINSLLRLRQWANHPRLIDHDSPLPSGKHKEVTEYLQTLATAKKKVLIFSSFVQHLEIYTEWCESQQIPYQLLTGKTPIAQREKMVGAFQENDDILFFFISIKAGGSGLNLTQASYVILLDPWWNPSVERQAIDRAYRMGQKNHVLVTRFITRNSIEEKIRSLQHYKKDLAQSITSTFEGTPSIKELENLL